MCRFWRELVWQSRCEAAGCPGSLTLGVRRPSAFSLRVAGTGAIRARVVASSLEESSCSRFGLHPFATVSHMQLTYHQRISKAILCLLSVFVACTPSRTSQDLGSLTPFDIEVTVVNEGLEASCREGCSWSRLTAKAPGRSYHISTAGVVPATSSTYPADVQFGFIVNVRDEGIAVRCSRGCTWVTVDAQYPNKKYRITERGIEPSVGTR
jgi:hypothetical protein